MKFIVIACLSALLVGSHATQVREAMSPVTRVVNLLKNLAKQIEKEGKMEEDLYESFVCWGKSVIAQKTDSNSAAKARIDSLETYIADLDGGKIELTTERQDLEKEIEDLTADLDNLKAVRDKEKKDFDSAELEMSQAVSALTSAVKVLNEATKDNKKGAMLAYRAELNGGIAALEKESANLNSAVELGERFLTKSDAVFLRRLLTGDVPERDNKMLRKKADFKMSYKTRSGKIQDVLGNLKKTFAKNLKEAQDKEADAVKSYDKLSGSKGESLQKAEDARTSMDVENGAKGKSKGDAQDEIDALQKNVENDDRFISETTTALEEKKEAWDERTRLRDGELGAISKAINILYNDDARDLMKKSHASQGFLFLQEESHEAAATLGRAVTALKDAARRTGDRRLADLAALAADPSAKNKFKPIIEAIDKMLAVMVDDEKKDKETKETCEKDRMDNTRKALLAGREIDEQTDTITKLKGEIQDLKEAIEKLLANKKQTQEELDAAQKIRNDENTAWKATDQDDADAAVTVKDATKVLKDHYKDFGSFVQKTYQEKAPTVVAGEAPPPPPSTFDAPYGGKKGESTGIISILEMVYEDLKKDQAKAKEEEDTSQKEFDDFKENAEKEMEDLQNEADEKSGIKGEKETAKASTVTERKTKHGEWSAVMDTMADISPNCEYYAVNFKMRKTNRNIEVDGLNKAKAILSGGSFKL